MSLTLHQGLTGLSLYQGMAVTANPAGISCLYSDVVTHRANAAPVPDFERYQQGEVALPEVVSAVKLDFRSLEARLEMLFIDSLTRWDRNQAQNQAPQSGLFITAPVTISTNQLDFLGLDTCKTVVQATDLETGLGLWQQAMQANPEIDCWYWLALDSHCVMDCVRGHRVWDYPG